MTPQTLVFKVRPQLPFEIGVAVIGRAARFRPVMLFKSCFDITTFHAASADEIRHQRHFDAVGIHNGATELLKVQARSTKVLA